MGLQGDPCFGYFGSMHTMHNVHNGYSGSILYDFLTESKVPSAMDIPADIRLELYNSGKNKGLVLGSKAVGETSLLGGVSVLMALRYSGQSLFLATEINN